MPELPEVETVVQDLRKHGLIGAAIVKARVGWTRTIAEPRAAQFRRLMAGRTVQGLGRRGKYIVVRLSDGWTLLVHLRMTGQLTLTEAGSPRSRHHHVVLDLDDGRELRFSDTRKFGRWHLVRDPQALLARLGPEPLAPSMTGRRFSERLAARTGMLKPLLLDQGFLAGLGNIYVDEALWEAGLHPRRRAHTLSPAQRRVLYRAVRTVLRRGVRALGTTLGEGSTNFYSVSGRRGRNKDNLRVFRRTGKPCARCRSPIERIVVGQRSTHICPQCQPLHA
jgi:formamidopyrimidine-DNA glycosylase